MKHLLTIVIITLSFSPISAQDFELIPYRVKSKWGFANSKEKIKIKPKFQDVIPFNQGFSAYKEKGKWGFIDIQGRKTAQPQFDSISGYFRKFYIGSESEPTEYQLGIEAYQNGQSHLVDINGIKFKNSPETIEIVADESPSEYIEIIEKDGLYGFVNTENNITSRIVYYDFKISDIGIIAKSNLKGEVINLILNLKTLEPFVVGKYESITPTKDETGFYIVNKDGKMGYFKSNGKPEIAFKYEDIIKLPHSEQEFAIRAGSTLYGYMDLSKEPVKIIQPKYLYIGRFVNGYAKVLTRDGKSGYINYEENEFFNK